MNGPWKASIKHVFREANSCADKLANASCNQLQSEIIYNTCPLFCYLHIVGYTHQGQLNYFGSFKQNFKLRP